MKAFHSKDSDHIYIKAHLIVLQTKTKRLRHGPVAFFFVELLQGRPQTEGEKEALHHSSFPVTRCPGPM